MTPPLSRHDIAPYWAVPPCSQHPMLLLLLLLLPPPLLWLLLLVLYSAVAASNLQVLEVRLMACSSCSVAAH